MYPGKHEHPSAYTPADFLGWALRSGWVPGPLPVGVVFTFQAFVTRHLAEHPERFTENHTLAPSNARVFFTADDGPTVAISCLNPGAATLVGQVENLRYLDGPTRFIAIGTAGGLVPDLAIADVVLIDRALRDDGISAHYLPPGRYVDPPGGLTARLREALAGRFDAVHDATTWTVPTAYRTTPDESAAYVAEGVTVVEMEAAALFAVTQALGVESAAAVVISDVARADAVEVEWRDTVQPLLTVLEAAIEAIRSSPAG